MEFNEASSVFEMEETLNGSSDEVTSNPPRSHETVSVFGESSCGVPLFAQHLRINFTPFDMDNSDIVQKKCVDFWNFINNTQEIQDLLVMPEPFKFTSVEDSRVYLQEVNRMASQNKTPSVERTAVSTLELVKGKGLIDRTFEAKLPQSRCSIGYKDYCNEDFVPRFKPQNISTKPLMKKESSVYTNRKKVTDQEQAEASAYAKKICKSMTDWDSKRNQVLGPPGQPPSLHHCIMERLPY